MTFPVTYGALVDAYDRADAAVEETGTWHMSARVYGKLMAMIGQANRLRWRASKRRRRVRRRGHGGRFR